jgi:hypothetical protein
MRNWNKPAERREATSMFVEYLHKKENENKADRKKCKKDNGYAKKLFAKVGEIEGIPEKTEFHVYEKMEIEPRDSEFAILLLPDPNKPIPAWLEAPLTKATNAIDVSEVYRCTWDPWAPPALRHSGVVEAH